MTDAPKKPVKGAVVPDVVTVLPVVTSPDRFDEGFVSGFDAAMREIDAHWAHGFDELQRYLLHRRLERNATHGDD